MNAAPDLAALPLFPLNTVLFPAGVLTLQIFEVRYLDMIGKCHKNGTPFGVVSLVKGKEVRSLDPRRPTGDAFPPEQFSDVGTLARIVEFSAPQAGLMAVRCVGQERFQIQQRSQLKHGLWMAQVTSIAPDLDMPIPEDLQPIAYALARLLETEQSAQAQFEPLPVERPYRLEDCGWVANRWCDLLALPAQVKQNLLQLDNPLLRLELVGDILGKLQSA
jgi:Lon protease-like protein